LHFGDDRPRRARCNGGIVKTGTETMTRRLIYLLHSGQLFGTERMALATLQALRDRFEGWLVAPPGPVHEAARAAGVHTVVLQRTWQLPWVLGRALAADRHAAILATGVAQSLCAALLQAVLRGRGAHLHAVHGGTDERLSYGRKRLLAALPVRFVAVSPFVRERLVAHGVPADRIEVVHNFLPGAPPAQRAPFGEHGAGVGVKRVVMLSRLDRIKRVGLLFDALDATPELAALQFDLYGSGEEASALAERARRHANVRLHGFVPDAARALADADLLLHTCPEEPFGLVVLEAFAAGVPVLVPNSGGAGELVRHGIDGWHFTANSPVALGRQLLRLHGAEPALLDALASGGRRALQRRFDPQRQARRYLQLAGALR
jgi:glycosyltransferase involved in cell wall biosynthesis